MSDNAVTAQEPSRAQDSQPSRPSRSRLRLLLLVPAGTIIFLLFGFWNLRGDSPTLYVSDAKINDEQLVVTITNKGKTAIIGSGWCGAGVAFTPGNITNLVYSDTGSIFRYAFLAPDQREALEVTVPSSVIWSSDLNPIWAKVNPATKWDVGCVIPYADARSRWIKSDTLKFCYVVQQSEDNTHRITLPCHPVLLDKVIAQLGRSQGSSIVVMPGNPDNYKTAQPDVPARKREH